MSQINVNTITNRTGSGGPVISGLATAQNGLHVTDGDVNVIGIVTATTFSGNVNAGIITAQNGLHVTGGDVNVTGIVTATKFYGDGSELSGIAGVNTTTTAERNAGVNTTTGTVIYNITENAIQAYSGSEWNLAPGKVSAFRAYLNSNQSIIDAGTTSPQFRYTRITFDNNSSLDNLGEFNTTNNSFVVSHTGVYYLTATITWGANNSMVNGGEVRSRLIKNGTYTGNLLTSGGTVLTNMFSRTFTAGNLGERGVYHTLSWVGPLTTGDSIAVNFYQRSGITFSLSSGTENTSFSGFRVA